MDLSTEYGVHPTFNITDLVPIVGTFDEEDDHQDLRANPLQEGGDDVTPTTGMSHSPSSPLAIFHTITPLLLFNFTKASISKSKFLLHFQILLHFN